MKFYSNHEHGALYRYWEAEWRGRKGRVRLLRLTVLRFRAYLPPGFYGPKQPLLPRIERTEPGTYQLRWCRIVLLLNLNKYRIGFKSIDPTTGKAPTDQFGRDRRIDSKPTDLPTDDYIQALGRVRRINGENHG